ncbi:tyrosine-protein phosphatase [Cupriavidus sp. EM10]|uniref:tyrosine-protein phosphatase n=2 Tax=unclassified Cupriavidus TaxID=2640874 RepID=UPI001C006895|nr:tyrosine-protein phosphatase [Cupriavidus sp. EM10]MCA3184909.1 tyrosine-protein phosphatase [Cupriavidus sp.]MCA3192542.1 tyrosine-protein phosphatase [Cupriavidus sp.]MCA3200085.1 tyrosine-protein phosphatase [Cupriavidus sp.]MCA3203504.1 tyrosine-protein phosphatase [Cupriavidus sp.]MCA3208820.1 tyrosine-protein phosphatase [Cupriavidus sp.]
MHNPDEIRAVAAMRPCLDLETIANARDLGGLVGHAGRRIRQNRLYRSANPALGCAADLDKLHALQLDIVVDFRSTGEKSPAEDAFGERFEWLAVPVLDGTMSMDVLLPRLRASNAAQMHGFMLDVYRDFPVRYRQAFGTFLRHAEAGKTLYYHCTAGKDRTGFASLLLLGALGVSQDDIVANYLESNHWNQRFNERMLAGVGQIGVTADAMLPLLEVRPEYIEASMDAITATYGSLERFLADDLGVDVAVLRDHYLVS